MILAYAINEAVMNLAEHPTVRRFHENQAGHPELAEPSRPP
jgi:hypothetical protein